MSCELQLDLIDLALARREAWAIRFFDLWAKLSPGILHRNVRNFGLFTECVRFRHNSSDNQIGFISGQYCTVSHRSIASSVWVREGNFRWKDIGQTVREKNLQLQSGFCMPAACSVQQVIEYSNRFLQRADLQATKAVCHRNESGSLTVVDFIAISIVAVLLLVLLTSTMHDIIMRSKPGVQARKIFTAFSLYSNIEDLLTLEKNNSRSIDCMHGLRALSAFWIVAGHRMTRHNRMVSRPMKNENLLSQLIIGLFLSNEYAVDTFFLISGVLIAQSCLSSLDKKQQNLVKIYCARYLRYVPTLALLLLLFTSSLPHIISDGPIIDFLDNEVARCERFWWSSLLLVQNYVNVNSVCLPHTWYLSTDFQLFLLSPVFIYMLWKFKNKALWVFGLIVVISQLSIFLVRFYETVSIHVVYRQTHFRIGQFLIGIALGYVMYKREGKHHMRKRSQAIGWIVSLGSFVAVEAFFQTVSASFAEALFTSTHRIAWACLTGWIVYVCHHLKSGGFVNWFLSQPLWYPIAKISLSIYLIHDIYIVLTVANMKDLWYFEPAWLMHIVLGDIAASTILGGVLYLAIEAPSNLVVRYFLK